MEFESGVFDNNEHAILVKINVALLTSVSLSEAMHVPSHLYPLHSSAQESPTLTINE